MTPIEILSRFIGKRDPREYCHHPFLDDHYVCATDGAILVRMPLEPDMAFKKHTRSPKNIGVLFDKCRASNRFEIPELPALNMCSVCGGKGSLFEQDCQDCDGDGCFDHGSHTYECKACDGAGTAPGGDKEVACYNCGALGVLPLAVWIGGAFFDARYLAKIIDLPGIMFNVVPGNSNAAAYFTFDGGEGLLMPRRPD